MPLKLCVNPVLGSLWLGMKALIHRPFLRKGSFYLCVRKFQACPAVLRGLFRQGWSGLEAPFDPSRVIAAFHAAILGGNSRIRWFDPAPGRIRPFQAAAVSEAASLAPRDPFTRSTMGLIRAYRKSCSDP